MDTIKVGDQVRIIGSNLYRKSPEAGHRATVIKVGRKYATATYTRMRTAHPAGEVTETIEFDITTGREKGSTSNYGARVETPEQVELRARQSAAEDVLSTRKIRLDFGHGLTLEQIEALAEVVKTWED